MKNNKYNDGNFKVFNDYLIQDPSEYGIKDTYHKTNQNDVAVDFEDWGSNSLQLDDKVCYTYRFYKGN